jgi:hypothetical protein
MFCPRAGLRQALPALYDGRCNALGCAYRTMPPVVDLPWNCFTSRPSRAWCRFTKAALLPKYTRSQAAASRQRKCPRCRQSDCATPEYERSRHPQERRYALRPAQTHSPDGSFEAARSMRARDEVLLAATARNLRRLAKLKPSRPPLGIHRRIND